MPCGIICPRDSDGYDPFVALARLRAIVDSLPGVVPEPKMGTFERRFWIGFCMAIVISQLCVLGLLAYGVISIVVAAL